MSRSGALTLMAVHAHPDDEATGTGGILARYADEGVTTVLVTCTDGQMGDGPGGVKPGEPGHDPDAVVAMRRQELARSCQVLGVSHLELLGYPDSGMMGWEANDRPGSLWTTPVEPVAQRLVSLFERYRPDVVVTYDENGFYGHPDHIQAHRVTVAAFDACDIPKKLYFPTVPRSRLPEFAEAMKAAGVDFSEEGVTTAEGVVTTAEGVVTTAEGVVTTSEQRVTTSDERTASDESEGPSFDENFGSPDEDIAAVVDCSSVVKRKFEALRAHESQADNVFFLRLPDEIFERFFGQESFVLFRDRTDNPNRSRPEDDLFAGLR